MCLTWKVSKKVKTFDDMLEDTGNGQLIHSRYNNNNNNNTCLTTLWPGLHG